jgi:hypothetical protein
MSDKNYFSENKIEKESIRYSINKAKEEIRSWPDWKKAFLGHENDNTFSYISLEDKI